MAAMRRRLLAGTVLCLVVAALSGCGFKLRASQDLPFESLAITPERAAGVAGDMARYLGSRVRPLAPGAGGEPPQVILDILQEAREKLAVGLNTSGQVREYELRLSVRFRLRGQQGAELIAPSVIEQHRSISFNESSVLAKESEEALLYRDMQADVVQQLLRRLAAVKLPGTAALPASPATPATPAASE